MVTAGEYGRTQGKWIRAYEKAHGDPIGKPCFHCGEPIPHRWADSLKDSEQFPYRDAFTVHHIDYDKSNEAPANLAPSHHRCNSGDRSPEGMARIKAAQQEKLKGRKLPVELVERMRAGWTPERRAISAETMRRIQQRRIRCNGCKKVSTPGGIKLHQLHSGHEGRVRVS